MDSNPYKPPDPPRPSIDTDPDAAAKNRRSVIFGVLVVVVIIGSTIYEFISGFMQAKAERR
jgi:hypothetical protein